MADVKWIKIVTDIFDDEKILLIETLPEADSIIVIWFKLLCLAGKQNNSGVFVLNDKMPYDEKMFATIFRRKETTVRLALQTFEQFGMIEMIENIVTIPNWGKHQSLEQMEARKNYMKKYMREYREGQKQLIDSKHLRKHLRKQDVNPPDKTREDKNREDTYRQMFNEFWKIYPNKKAKDAAYKSWLRIKPDKELFDKIINKVSAYKQSEDWKKENGRFIPHPATWLNQGRWEDEIYKQPSSNPFKDYYLKEIENEQNRSGIPNGDNQNVLPRILPPDERD